jgi:superfamily II DNA or RNA helicase
VGDVWLHPHQRVAVARLLAMLDRHGGALLADDVGLGKTFAALAVARRAASTLVIAPAGLRRVWTDAARRAAVAVRFASIESLARSGNPEPADLVIVDEAHHFRSPRTKRYAAARRLCEHAKVLLLSATPVQNRVRDLRNILALFLGERAHAASTGSLAEVIVRRLAEDVAGHLGLPSVEEPVWVRPPADVDCLERLLALPPPVPPSDGGDAGALLTYSLVRQWASSRAALRAALARRLARARALDDALASGRWPSRGELSAWQFADGAQQLTFPELVTSSPASDRSALREQVLRHADAVRDLSAWLSATANPDLGRAELLVELIRQHAGERVVVFSEYAETVGAMFRALLQRARVAMLTHAGGRVAGGYLGRDELLAQFSNAGSRVRPSERVDLLISTDVLSEGVDLQAASVVVHLDLSWNPARLEQRVGRLRRIGSARDRVAVYAVAPPAPAERLLRLERRLHVKLGAAASSVGLAGAIIPGLAAREPSPVAHGERIERVIRDWRTEGAPADPVVGAVRSTLDGALACVRRDGRPRLMVYNGNAVTDAVDAVERLVRAAGGVDRPVHDGLLRHAVNAFTVWMSRRAIAEVIDLPSAHVARARHRVLRRVHAIAQRAPRHERASLREMLGAARSVATATLSSGAERVLDELARAELPDVAWLQSLGQFAAIHARATSPAPDEILAVLLLCAE